MIDRLSGKPVTFDHPEKLTQGVSLEKGDVTAKSFISEVDGEVKSNIVIENRVTGEIAKRDAVIGEIVESENENENDDLDSSSNLGLNSGLGLGMGMGMNSGIGLAPGLVSDYGLGSGIGLDVVNNKRDNNDN